MDPALRETSFLTQTVPDVQPHTRILAVCGISDHLDAAHPNYDGWLLSDFYAFNLLLRNEGVAQTWLTTESPAYLVSKHQVYLHGAAYISLAKWFWTVMCWKTILLRASRWWIDSGFSIPSSLQSKGNVMSHALRISTFLS